MFPVAEERKTSPASQGPCNNTLWLRLVHLDVEDCSKELLRQQNGGILRSKVPSRGLWMPELVLYSIRLLAQVSLGKFWTNESAVM